MPFLAAALKVVTCGGFLWHRCGWQRRRAQDAQCPGHCSEPGGPAHPPVHLCPSQQEPDTPALLSVRYHRGSAVCQGKRWSPLRKGWLLLGRLSMCFIQNVSKRKDLACVARGLTFVALRKCSPQWKCPSVWLQNITHRWTCVQTPSCARCTEATSKPACAWRVCRPLSPSPKPKTSLQWWKFSFWMYSQGLFWSQIVPQQKSFTWSIRGTNTNHWTTAYVNLCLGSEIGDVSRAW